MKKYDDSTDTTRRNTDVELTKSSYKKKQKYQERIVSINEIIRKLSNDEELSLLEKSELEVFLRNKSKYGLNWMEIPEMKKIGNKEYEINEFLKNNKPYLKYNKQLSIKGDGNNLLIEGDNYETLMGLLPIYKESVDVIYIDPPYNTGKSDFMYNDRYSKKEDSDHHSRWLSFMDKRLKLAYKLLKPNGIIGISIGNNEDSNLELLTSSIFNEKNKIMKMIKLTSGGKNDSKYIKEQHEYLLVYKKGEVNFSHNKEKTDATSKDQILSKWGNTSARMDRPNMAYPIYVDKVTNQIHVSEIDPKCSFKSDLEKTKKALDKMYKLEKEYHKKIGEDKYFQIYPKLAKKGISKIMEGYWRWQKKDIMKKIDNLKVKNHKKFGTYIYEIVEKEAGCKDLIRSSIIQNFTGGPEALLELIGEAGLKFPYPKAVDYMKYFLQMHANRSALCLDFFGGTGTFGQAVLELNEEDFGCRNFILCTNNENKICEEITYPRLFNYINIDKKYSLNYFNIDYFKKAPREKTKKNLNKIITNLLMVKENCYQVKEERKDYAIIHNKILDKKVVIIKDSEGIELNQLKSLIKENKKSKFYINECIGIEKYLNKINYELIPKEFYRLYENIDRVATHQNHAHQKRAS